MMDDFPANPTNYLEGLIKLHWEKNKVENLDLNEFLKVSDFVSKGLLKVLISINKVYLDLPSSCWLKQRTGQMQGGKLEAHST